MVEPRLPLCKVFGGRKVPNITIYILLAIVAVIGGALYVRTWTAENDDELKKRMKTFNIYLGCAIIVGAILLAIFFILGEWAWDTKCIRLEDYMNEKFSYLKRSFNVDNIASTVTNRIADALTGAINRAVSQKTGGLIPAVF